MMKWFRAHTKQIMAFLVLVAMFSFVGGSALVNFLQPDPSKEPYGVAFGRKFNQGEIYQAQRDVSTLEMVFGRQQPALKAKYGEIWQCGYKDLTVAHWYLLTVEADRAGIEVSDKELDDQMENLPANLLEALRVSRDQITPDEIRHALRRQLAIEKNSRRITSAAAPSETQVRHFVRDTEDKAKVRFVALDAEKFIDEKAPVSQEELQAQFEKYKDVDSSKSDDGFGYRHPRRVKMQYVVAQIPLIAPGVEVSMDAVKSTWKANKAGYKKVIYVEPPTTAPSTSGPTSQPDKPQPVPKTVEKSFSEAQADVERNLRQKAAVQAADQAMRKIQSQLQRPWLDEKTDASGYKPIPSAAKEPGLMKSVCERMAIEFKIPLDYGETPLVSKDELSKLSKIGGTSLTGGGNNLPIEEYAFRVPPFFAHTVGTDTMPSLQWFQVPDMPLTLSTNELMGGNMASVVQKLVLFRVVEAREAEAPAALDEVRAAVERDVRLSKAFAGIEPTAKELHAASLRLGVEKALELFADLREKRGAFVTTPPAFARFAHNRSARLLEKMSADEPTLVPTSVPGVGASKEFMDACFEMTASDWKPPALELPKSERMAAATTRPAVEPAPKVKLVSLPKRHKWCVVELAGTEPVDEGKFDTQFRQMAYYSLMSERGMALRDEWFRPKDVEKRCGFQRLTHEGELTPNEGVGPGGRPPPTPYF